MKTNHHNRKKKIEEVTIWKEITREERKEKKKRDINSWTKGPESKKE